MNSFEQKISDYLHEKDLHNADIDTIQVNVGLVCNQECFHCHLKASPHRTEIMGWPVMEKVIGAATQGDVRLIDITGGAPELNPNLKRFIRALRENDHSVQIRTNLTVLYKPEMESFPGFYRKNKVQLVASMPCYLEENVCSQRGKGVYEKSIEILRRLNESGYGIEPDLSLNLVYNPGGTTLPGEQSMLETAYKKELGERFGIRFSRLLTITNMPIGRFLDRLRSAFKEKEYMRLLKKSFNPEILDDLMCRHQLNIGWDGTLYDCDFNLALGLPVNHGAPDTIDDFDLSVLAAREIVTGEHCFGCTAGFGSSCAGALVNEDK